MNDGFLETQPSCAPPHAGCSLTSQARHDRPRHSGSRGHICLLQSFLSTRYNHLMYDGFPFQGRAGHSTDLGTQRKKSKVLLENG